MKTLLTIITPEIAEHCTELRANHEEYAGMNGYVYRAASELYWPDLAASFSKVAYISGALENQENEVVIWADADVAFTNMTVDLSYLLAPDYWLAGYDQQNKEWIGPRPYLCAGLMVIRNCETSRAFFRELMRLVGTRTVLGHPFEQWHLDSLLVASKFAGVKLCDVSEIGCFSREFWNDGEIWHVGCPTVHISTSGNWEGRRKVFVEKYMPFIARDWAAKPVET